MHLKVGNRVSDLFSIVSVSWITPDRFTMIEKIMASLESLPTENLLIIRKNLDELIKSKYDNDLGKRKGTRAKVKIAGNVEIEREKEFFFKLHKIIIQEMSVNGLVFTLKGTVIDGDILRVSFRVPSTGEKKLSIVRLCGSKR